MSRFGKAQAGFQSLGQSPFSKDTVIKSGFRHRGTWSRATC